jgi:quinol monooxygenase YgiN
MIPAKTADVVISTFRLFPSREERRHLVTLLRSVQGPIQAQPHNQACQLYEEDGFDGAVLYLERWASEPELKRHVRSDVYRRILTAVELSHKPPEIVFDYVTSSRGIDLIEALRGELEI